MARWYCYKDKVEMVDSTVKMSYLKKTVPLPGGMKCPKCGAAYLPETLVMGKVVKAEEMIEKK